MDEKLVTWDDILKGLYTQPATTDPVLAQSDDLIANAQAEANRNPLIMVSIIIGILRLMQKK